MKNDLMRILFGVGGPQKSVEATPYQMPPAAAPITGQMAPLLDAQAVEPVQNVAGGDEWAEFETVGASEAPSQVAPSAPAIQPEAVPNAAPTAHPVAASPMPATEQAAGSHDDTTYQVDAATISEGQKAFTQQLGELVNGGASRDEVYAFLQANPHYSAQGVDEALAWRDANAGQQVPVGVNEAETRRLQLEALKASDPGAVGSALMGATQTITAEFGDEIDAGIGATIKALGGADFSEAYDERLAKNREILRAAEEFNSGSMLAGRLGGAVALPSVGISARAGASAARLGAEGLAYGAAAGAGAGENTEDRLKGAALGGVVGGVLGGATGAVLSPLARGAANAPEARAVLDAADNLNANMRVGDMPIQPLPGHVSNGGMTAQLHALSEPALTGSIGGLSRRSENYREGVGNALERIADDAAGGQSVSLNQAAARASDGSSGGLTSFEDDIRRTSRQAYSDAAALAGNVALSTPRAIARMDDILAEWDRVPGGVAGADVLRSLRNELAGGTWTVDGLRRLRTTFGENIDSTNTTAREAAGKIWPELSRDITAGLAQAGRRDAANAYRAADRAYARNVENVRIVRKLVGDGNVSSAQLTERLARMSAKDSVRLAQVMDALSPDVAGALRGGLIRQLGQRQASRATQADEFSIETFSTNWLKLDDQARGRLFTPSVRRDLDDLARLAGADRMVSRNGNPSRSGVFNQNNAELLGAVALGPVAVKALLARVVAAGLLASPMIARVMVNIAEGRSPMVIANGLARAERLAPERAGEIAQLRQDIAAITTEEPTTDDDWGEFEAVDPSELPASVEAAPAMPQQYGDYRGVGVDPNGQTIDMATGAYVDLPPL